MRSVELTWSTRIVWVTRKSQIHRNTFILNLNLLTLNVCGLRLKLLLVELIELMKSYKVICMCETRCDDVDMKNLMIWGLILSIRIGME